MGKPKKGRGAVIITGILFAISLVALIVLLVLKFRQPGENSNESTQDTVIETDTETGVSKPGFKDGTGTTDDDQTEATEGKNGAQTETDGEGGVSGETDQSGPLETNVNQSDPRNMGESSGGLKLGGNSGTGGPDSATAGNLGTLEVELTAYLKECQNQYQGDWSVYVKNLNTDEYFNINNKQMKAASLIKMFIMGTILEQINSGKLEETQTIYAYLEKMISVSDNESANELVHLLSSNRSFEEGRAVVNDWAKDGGYMNTVLNREFSDISQEYKDSQENKTSVEDCGKLLESIFKWTCVSEEKSDHMLQMLLAQSNRSKIPNGLPLSQNPELHCANKTGENAGVESDAAIVYTEDRSCAYVLCVMTQNLNNISVQDINGQNINVQTKIAEISKMVYEYINPNGTSDTQTGLAGGNTGTGGTNGTGGSSGTGGAIGNGGTVGTGGITGTDGTTGTGGATGTGEVTGR